MERSNKMHMAHNHILFRIFLYLFLSVIYFAFMAKASNLGIDWLDFHKNWTLNSVNNIFKNFEGIKYGLTTREVIDIAQQQKYQQENFYILPIYHYLHLGFVSLINGDKSIIFWGQLIDKIIILTTSILTGEIALKLINNRGELHKYIIGISAFSFFLTSPWTYRMLVAPWQEVYFFCFFLISLIFFGRKNINIGIVFYFLAGLCQYQWSFILSFIYLFSFVIGKLFIRRKNIINLIPISILEKKRFNLFILSGVFPTLIIFIQKILINFNSGDITYGGSSLLYRIGIDSYQNIHHSGWLGAIQFLGGNRITNCLSNVDINNIVNNLIPKISLFNCLISIVGMFVLSIASIIGYLSILNSNKLFQWILTPIFLSFFIFAMILQQSFAVHLQGYSFIFAFIFSIGLIYLIDNIVQKYFYNNITELFYIPFFFAIVFSSIRISFLTGING